MHDAKQYFAATVIGLFCSGAGAASEATLTAIGDMDSLVIGQDGYCGDRTHVDETGRQKIVLRGDEPLWLTAKSRFHMPGQRKPRSRVCKAERTFIPKAGNAYIFRMTHIPGDCEIELFRVVRDADPVREKMIIPASQSCLLE